MEVLEDDVFFADLNKQISLLIMEDEEDHPFAHCPSVPLQAFSRSIHRPAAQPPLLAYQQNCRREIKGTGVFIPQSPHPRKRKNKQGKFSSSNKKLQRHSEDSRSLPHESRINFPSQNSFPPK